MGDNSKCSILFHPYLKVFRIKTNFYVFCQKQKFVLDICIKDFIKYVLCPFSQLEILNLFIRFICLPGSSCFFDVVEDLKLDEN